MRRQDLKPSVFALGLPANNLIRFSEDFGGETNQYQGFDVNIEARFRNGAFLRGGIGAASRLFDNCNLLAAGVDAVAGRAIARAPRSIRMGTTACHREYPFRPDAKVSGYVSRCRSDIQLAGTYQFSRGVQTGGAGPSILAALGGHQRRRQPAALGRNWTGVASKTVQSDSRRTRLRRAQPASARYARRRSASVRPLPRPARLRPLQRVQQQLAVHGQRHVTRPPPTRPGCGRPTRCSPGSSNWEANSASRHTSAPSAFAGSFDCCRHGERRGLPAISPVSDGVDGAIGGAVQGRPTEQWRKHRR